MNPFGDQKNGTEDAYSSSISTLMSLLEEVPSHEGSDSLPEAISTNRENNTPYSAFTLSTLPKDDPLRSCVPCGDEHVQHSAVGIARKTTPMSPVLQSTKSRRAGSTYNEEQTKGYLPANPAHTVRSTALKMRGKKHANGELYLSDWNREVEKKNQRYFKLRPKPPIAPVSFEPPHKRRNISTRGEKVASVDPSGSRNTDQVLATNETVQVSLQVQIVPETKGHEQVNFNEADLEGRKIGSYGEVGLSPAVAEIIPTALNSCDFGGTVQPVTTSGFPSAHVGQNVNPFERPRRTEPVRTRKSIATKARAYVANRPQIRTSSPENSQNDDQLQIGSCSTEPVFTISSSVSTEVRKQHSRMEPVDVEWFKLFKPLKKFNVVSIPELPTENETTEAQSGMNTALTTAGFAAVPPGEPESVLSAVPTVAQAEARIKKRFERIPVKQGTVALSSKVSPQHRFSEGTIPVQAGDGPVHEARMCTMLAEIFEPFTTNSMESANTSSTLPKSQTETIIPSKTSNPATSTLHASPAGCTPSFSCNPCEELFPTTQLCRSHMYHEHNDNKQHVCESCGAVLRSKENLRRHSSVHGKNQPHACTFCTVRFSTVSGMKQHVQRQHKVRKEGTAEGPGYQALESFSLTNGSSDLRRCKPPCIPCPVPGCTSVLSRHSGLKRHIQIVHEGEKPFSCSQCARTFATKYNMNLHVRRMH